MTQHVLISKLKYFNILYTSARTPQPTIALIQEPLWGIRIYCISKSNADNQKTCMYNPYIDPSLDVNRR